MLNSIFDILQGIWDFFELVIDLVIGLIQDIVYFVQLIIALPGLLGSTLKWLPPATVSIILLCISLFVVLRVIGRD